MSAPVSVAETPIESVECVGCGERVATAYCQGCADEGDDECDDGGGGNVAERVRDYAERRRMLGLMSPEIFAAFELCAEDLEAVHG